MERRSRSRARVVGWVVVLALAAIVPPVVLGDVVLTSRESEIHVLGAVNNGEPFVDADMYDTSSWTSSTVLPFADLVSDAADVAGHHIDSFASQSSTLTTEPGGYLIGAWASGATHAYRMDVPIPPGGGYGFGSSFFDVFFTVTLTSAPYALHGAVDTGGAAGGFAEVELRDAFDTVLHSWHVEGAVSPLAFDTVGELPVGSYWLHAQAYSTPGTPAPNTADFNVTLEVPEPATLTLLAFGGIGLAGRVVRKRRAA